MIVQTAVRRSFSLQVLSLSRAHHRSQVLRTDTIWSLDREKERRRVGTKQEMRFLYLAFWVIQPASGRSYFLLEGLSWSGNIRLRVTMACV